LGRLLRGHWRRGKEAGMTVAPFLLILGCRKILGKSFSCRKFCPKMQTLGAENSHSVKIQDKIGTFEQHDFSRQCCLSLIRRKFVVSIGKLRHPAPLTFLRHE